MKLCSIVLVCALVGMPQAPERDAAAAGTKGEAGPPAAVRYFSLEGEIDGNELRGALHDAPSEAASYRLLYGPVSAKPRPGLAFVAIEVTPADAGPRDLVRLLGKHADGVEELAWTEFQGGSTSLPSILGQPPRDCVIGMASEMRWFFTDGERKVFFFAGSKLDADDVAERFHRLFEPFQAGDVGAIVVETLRQPLAPSVDAEVVERALKVVRKLPGVERAALDDAVLVVTARLEGQRTSGTWEEWSGEVTELPLPRYDLAPVLAILRDYGVTVASSGSVR